MSDKFNAKDYYNELQHGRELEIDNLWKRSVFLGAFILAIAAGYGNLALKILTNGKSAPLIVHLAAAGLCILGVTFSILWIMMAKGSKFWYEAYEGAIGDCLAPDYGKDSRDNGLKLHNEIFDRFTKDKLTNTDIYEVRKPDDNKTVDCNILTTHAGAFSVSRINVLIGIVCFIAWGGLLIIHCFKVITMINFSIEICKLMFPIVLAVVISVFLIFILSKILELDAKSSYAEKQ